MLLSPPSGYYIFMGASLFLLLVCLWILAIISVAIQFPAYTELSGYWEYSYKAHQSELRIVGLAQYHYIIKSAGEYMC